jgi:hypothetical protein
MADTPCDNGAVGFQETVAPPHIFSERSRKRLRNAWFFSNKK